MDKDKKMPGSLSTGEMGENLAAEYYCKQGYTILQMNYRTRHGEIDIIAQKENLLIFVEVKSRKQNAIAAPREWVTRKKQEKIMMAADEFLVNFMINEPYVRFDVVEVTYKPDGTQNITCIQDAFTA